MVQVKREGRVGQGWGRLTVVYAVPNSRKVGCQCECGNTVEVNTYNLIGGRTLSCGCLRSEWARDNFTKHGKSGSSTYLSWRSMKSRVENVKDKNFAVYGGRGIKFDPRWDDFSEFFLDMGERPRGTTLDRYPDNKGDYTKNNCRWASMKQQFSNRVCTLYVVFMGEEVPFSDTCKEIGVNRTLVYSRYASRKTRNPSCTLQSVFDEEIKKMKFAFIPYGHYKIGQVLNVQGREMRVESYSHTGRNAVVTTLENAPRFERVVCICTDSEVIKEVSE